MSLLVSFILFLCLAFSPVVYGQSGSSVDCGFQFTKEYHFRPITEDELTPCALNKDKAAIIKEVKHSYPNLFLLRLLCQCYTPADVENG